MIVYEVLTSVEKVIAGQYETYMKTKHVADVLATGCFAGATFARAAADEFQARYIARDRETLERYITDHAPGLRADFAAHFPEGVRISRTVYEVLEEWTAPA